MEAAEHDAVAASIVERLVGEIVVIVRAAAARLDLREAEVLLGGGLMSGAREDVFDRIAAGLGDSLTLHRPSAPPIVGAALLALDAVGADEQARRRARDQLVAAVEGLDG
jgi:hypothetical protein